MQHLLNKLIFILITGFFLSVRLHAQTNESKKWLLLFLKPFDSVHIATQATWDALQPLPDKEKEQALSLLDQNKKVHSTETGESKLALLKGIYCRSRWANYEGHDWKYWSLKALKTATAVGDIYMQQSCCTIIGDAYLASGSNDTAVFYMLKSIELAETLPYKKETLAGNRIAISNALYRTQNYTQCIQFCTTDVDIENTFSPIAVITAYNNLGLSYLKLQQPDSALFFFSKAEKFAQSKHWGIWEGIAAGNIGDAMHEKGKDDNAMRYWQKDFDSCIQYGELENAALTLAFISEYQFTHGEQQKAVNQLHWAQAMNQKDPGNLLRIYSIKAGCYRKMGLHDSADYYYQHYYHLEDSINRIVAKNNFSTVQLKLAYEKNSTEYRLLKKEQEAEVTRRNLLLLALFSIVVMGILLYNRQRLKIKLVKQQHAIAEAQISSAKEQLKIFTQTLLEKNEQIEQLTASLEQQTITNTDELIHQTLLTDYDWNRFKELFEKIHPAFFSNLKAMAAGITQSEMRLAALIKLNLDNKQMASMQGISLSSLRGNKTRLRQKLNLSPETELEEMIKQL